MNPKADPAPDIVDRMFDYIAQHPHMAQALQDIQASNPNMPDILDQAKTTLRAEFGGQRTYVRKGEPVSDTAQRILKLFDGRNPTQVARSLGIGRATVYRHLRRHRP